MSLGPLDPPATDGPATGSLRSSDRTDTDGTRMFAGGGRSRVGRLGEVVAGLAAVRDMDELVEAIVDHSAEAVGARVASLSVLEPETKMLRLAAIDGALAQARRRWATYPLSSATPAAEALREARMVVVSGRAAIEQRYPALAGEIVADGTLLCLPLIAGDRKVGVVSLSTPDRWTPDAGEVEILTLFADTCAQALERIHALADAAERADKLRFLAAASAELASNLDYQATLSTVARLAVPTIADWCAVELIEDERLRTLAVAHVDPAKVALAEDLQRRYPSDPSAPTGSPNVVRTGRSEWHPVITGEMLAAATHDQEHLQLARELGLRSALVVPLLARGRALGAITLIFAESNRAYRETDIGFAEDLARRAATAIDNAQLHSQTRDAARQLQHAVLPEDLTGIAGWEIASVYRPAGRAGIGGDFYDAIPIDDARITVVTGDVMGHGVNAAAAMAHMRAAVHAYIALDPDPAAVMSNLDAMFAKFDYSRLVSMVYILLDPAAGELSLVNAGHCPPLLIGADGDVTFLHDESSPLLGVGPRTRAAAQYGLAAGSVLLTYTDGLIERRGEAINTGLSRLAQAARRLPNGTLSEQLPAVVDQVGDAGRNDDITAMAIRIARDRSAPPA